MPSSAVHGVGYVVDSYEELESIMGGGAPFSSDVLNVSAELQPHPSDIHKTSKLWEYRRDAFH